MRFISISKNYLQLVLVFSLINMLYACNNGTNSNSTQANNTLSFSTPATIPVYNGSSTNSVIYLHNNSNHTISGISYTSSNDKFIITHGCDEILANSSCALHFTTPIVGTQNSKGSSLVSANYILNNNTVHTSQILNYSIVTNNQQIQASADTNLTNGYGTIYLYTNASYQLDNLSINNPNLQLTNQSGTILSSGQVIALEITNQDVASSQTGQLSINYTSGNNIQSSTQFSITAVPVSNGAILTSGQVSPLNTAVTIDGSLLILNSGNSNAELATFIADGGMSIINSGANRCTESMSLPAGNSCIIYFSVPQVSGDGVIGVTSNVTTLNTNIEWYNGIDGVLLTINTNPSTINFEQNATSELITVTATNIGGYTLNNMSIIPATNINDGSAVVNNTPTLTCVDSNMADTESQLLINGSCSYQITLTDNIVESDKYLKLGVTGNYTNTSGNQSYSRVTMLSYTIEMPPPAITITTSQGTTSSVGDLTVGESFNIIATLTNGTGVPNQTISLSAIESVIYTPATCDVSEATPSCSINVSFESSINIESYQITVSNTTLSPVATPEPSEVNFNLFTPLYVFRTTAGHNGNFFGGGAVTNMQDFCKADTANPLGAGNGTWNGLVWNNVVFNTSRIYRVVNYDGSFGSFTATATTSGNFYRYDYYKLFVSGGAINADGLAWTGMDTGGAQSINRCANWGSTGNEGMTWSNDNGSNASTDSITCDNLLSLICVQQ